jgi:hypothetical protein
MMLVQDAMNSLNHLLETEDAAKSRCERLSSILRFETFDDFNGQRTGFPGLYVTPTGGIQFRLNKGIIIRSELRDDYNVQSRPFEGKHDLLTAASDLIVRW